MSNEWFNEKLAPGGNTENGCHPDEAEAMKRYLRGETTELEAAHAITRPIENSDNPKKDLSRLWSFLINALIELPFDSNIILLKLITAIEYLPEPDMTGVVESNRPADGNLWHGLPGFLHAYVNLHKSSDWRELATKADTKERDRLREYQVNKARIEACLAVRGLAGIPMDWGYETVADALERSDALLDIEVPAAE